MLEGNIIYNTISKKRTGNTLVELIATMAIIGLVMTPISIILYNGYKAYFEEQDKMIALSKANEAVELMINDLRKFEQSSTKVDNLSEQHLIINDSLIYTYDTSDKTILKNSSNIFANFPDIKILNFKVEEIVEVGYDAKLIVISIELQYRKSEVIALSNSYRRRY